MDRQAVQAVLTDARILHIQKAKGIAGSERHILSLCRGLRQLGARPEVLWLRQHGFPLDGLLALGREEGVPARCLPIGAHLDPLLTLRLRRQLQTEPPALLHLHLIHATLHGAAAARGAYAGPVVVTRHGGEPYQKLPWFRLAARLADGACAAVIAPSRWLADYTRRWDGTPREKVHIIRHGIALERFQDDQGRRSQARATLRERLGIAAGEVVIGCSARLHGQKDHDTLLHAFARLQPRAPRTRLILLGGGPRAEELRRLAQVLLRPAQERVHFLGEVPDVATVLPGFDIAAVITHREGFCLAALEGLAAGLPTVASDVGPLPELIEDGRQGYLVPPRDPDALSGVLERLVADPALRKRLGDAGAARARNYPESRMVAETAALYARLLVGRAPQAMR